MGIRAVGSAAAGALVAACILSAPGCGQTIIEIVNSPGDASAPGFDGAGAVVANDAGANNPPSFDATVGIDATDATDAGADAQVAVIVDGAAQLDARACPVPRHSRCSRRPRAP